MPDFNDLTPRQQRKALDAEVKRAADARRQFLDLQKFERMLAESGKAQADIAKDVKPLHDTFAATREGQTVIVEEKEVPVVVDRVVYEDRHIYTGIQVDEKGEETGRDTIISEVPLEKPEFDFRRGEETGRDTIISEVPLEKPEFDFRRGEGELEP